MDHYEKGINAMGKDVVGYRVIAVTVFLYFLGKNGALFRGGKIDC